MGIKRAVIDVVRAGHVVKAIGLEVEDGALKDKTANPVLVLYDKHSQRSYDGAVLKVKLLRALLALDDACLLKLLDGEPFFVLRGQDLLAPDLVAEWASRAVIQGGTTEQGKLDEAVATIACMLQWPNRRLPT